MWPNPQETADLVTFTEEILNRKLHFLCSECLAVKVIIESAVKVIIENMSGIIFIFCVSNSELVWLLHLLQIQLRFTEQLCIVSYDNTENIIFRMKWVIEN